MNSRDRSGSFRRLASRATSRSQAMSYTVLLLTAGPIQCLDVSIIAVGQDSRVRDGLRKEVARPINSARDCPSRRLREDCQLAGLSRRLCCLCLIVLGAVACCGSFLMSPGSFGMSSKPMDKYNAYVVSGNFPPSQGYPVLTPKTAPMVQILWSGLSGEWQRRRVDGPLMVIGLRKLADARILSRMLRQARVGVLNTHILT